MIAKLLINAIDLESKDNSGKTPLFYAIRKHNPKFVRMLIENGADVNAKDNQGNTPLYVAKNYIKDDKIIDILVEHGAREEGEPTTQSPKVNEEDTLENIKTYLAGGGDINARDDYGLTFLHKAVKNGHRNIVEFLLKKGVNFNLKANDGFAPLHYSVIWPQPEITKLLLDNGANANIQDKRNGFSPLHLTSMKPNIKSLDVARILIDHGVLINNKSLGGETALHFAVGNENLALVKLLLENGANVNSKDNNGDTPLHKAVLVANKEIVLILLGSGAEVNTKNDRGLSALSYAQSENENLQEIAEIMKKRGAKIRD